MKVFNLLNNTELEFDDKTVDVYAVVYAHVTEDRPELSSTFFNSVHDKTLETFYKSMPIIIGRSSVSCGNWATIKR